MRIIREKEELREAIPVAEMENGQAFIAPVLNGVDSFCIVADDNSYVCLDSDMACIFEYDDTLHGIPVKAHIVRED